jgi:hypothetical protein
VSGASICWPADGVFCAPKKSSSSYEPVKQALLFAYIARLWLPVAPCWPNQCPRSSCASNWQRLAARLVVRPASLAPSSVSYCSCRMRQQPRALPQLGSVQEFTRACGGCDIAAWPTCVSSLQVHTLQLCRLVADHKHITAYQDLWSFFCARDRFSLNEQQVRRATLVNIPPSLSVVYRRVSVATRKAYIKPVGAKPGHVLVWCLSVR